MKIAVLGAGVVGVTSAWYLRAAGHEVTVIERHAGPAQDASRANGGQISVSHALPWANPQAPLDVLRWLGREDAPLLFRPRADAAQWAWGLSFLAECLPGRAWRNTRDILALAHYSRDALRALRGELYLEYAQETRGILHFYTDASPWRRARDMARRLADIGHERELKTPDEMVALEPALAAVHSRLVGGEYAPDDESGDAWRFTELLAEQCAARGVTFYYDTTVRDLEFRDGRVAAVRLAGEGDALLDCEACVVALGAYTPLLLDPLGVRTGIYPVKGYSVSIAVGDSDDAPHMSLTDDEYKLVYSRLGDTLRVAGTAELAGYDHSINARRCDALLARTAALFPGVLSDAGDFSRATRWAGLRPATPSNLPRIGGTRYPNLFLNTGHGTLGWTLACGSARLLADIVSGRATDIASAPYATSG